MANYFEKNGDNNTAKEFIDKQLEYITKDLNKIVIVGSKDLSNSLARLYEVCRIDFKRILND